MKKATVTRVLCALLLCVLCFATACGNEQPPVTENTSSEATVSEESKAELFSNLPDKTYDADCVVLVEGDYMTTYASVEVCPQEGSYAGLNDAILRRNNLIKERFDVTISEIRTENAADMVTKLRNNATANASEYDLVMPYMSAAATIALDGYFYDLNKLPYIDLSASYYDQGSVKDLSIAGRNYFVTGDLSLLSFACTHALVFNKSVRADNNLEDPYELVKAGNWTIDKLQEMARKITADVDGETGMSYNDNYGFLVNNNFISSMFIGAGQRLSVKNEKDEPMIAVNASGANAVFNRLFDLVNDKLATGQLDNSTGSFYTTAVGAGKNIWSAATEAVANRHVLFRSMALIDIFDLGSYECSFGILPTPKFSEAQDDYYSRVSTLYASCIAIPTNVRDAEMSAVITDALMQASTDTVKDAYFQVILKERQIQDTESEEMLDIIFNSRVYDLASVYNWGGASEFDTSSLSSFMNSVAYSGVNTFTSTWSSIESKVQSAMDQTVDAFRSLTD